MDPWDDSDICNCGDDPAEWDEDCVNLAAHEAEYERRNGFAVDFSPPSYD